MRRGRGGETDSTEVELGRAREATGTQCSHAQMHSGNAASVAIHPREKQTHTPSDSDEVGVRETPDWADQEGSENSHSLADEGLVPLGD